MKRPQHPHRIAALVCSAVLLCLLAGCSQKPAEPEKTVTPSAPSQPKPELQKLVGKWERPDGGYVLELRTVDGSGKFEAGYFNPGPIHVERAQGVVDSEGTRLVVELRDENYPGCIYKLQYDPKLDQLYGTYYQAAIEQTYDVAFGRLKEP